MSKGRLISIGLGVLGVPGALSLALALTSIRPALAAGSDTEVGCRCASFEAYKSFSSLADEIAEVGPAAAQPTDGTVDGYGENGTSEIAALRLRITSDALIPPECRERLIKSLARVRVRVFGRIMAGASPSQTQLGAGGSNGMLDDYRSAWNQFETNALLSNCFATPTNACYAASANTAWGQFAAQIQSNPSGVGLGSASADELKILGAYQSIMASGSEAGALSYLRSHRGSLTTGQIIGLAQLIGLQLGNDYDNSRNQPGTPSSQGIITGDQLLAAASSNMEYGTNNKAGVCRDIATLQAKFLDAAGMPNSYVLTYGLPGDFHAIAISGDPADATKFHTYNYSIGATMSGIDGGEALLQTSSVLGVGIPEASLYYYLAKPEGATVAAIPSAMSKFLQEASGFDLHQIDPLARETSSMMGASVTFASDDGRVSATTRVLAGQDGVGAQYIGGAETVRYGQGTNTPGQVGVFVGQQIRPAAVYGTGSDQKAVVGYVEAEQHVILPKIKLGDNATLTVDNSATFSGAIGDITQGVGPNGAWINGHWEDQSQGLPFFGGNLNVRSEARVDQTSDGGKLRSTYRAGVEVSPGVQDVRQGAMWADPTLILNSAYVGTTQALRVGSLLLFGQATATADFLGTRGIAQIGVAGSKWAVSGQIAGRITDSTPLYEDNTLRRVGLSATVRPIPQLQLGVTGEMPIEGDAILSQTHVMGTAIVDF